MNTSNGQFDIYTDTSIQGKDTQSSKVFFAIFLGCSSACNANFSRAFRLSTLNKGLKRPR